MSIQQEFHFPGSAPSWEYQENTHQVPKGAGSIFDALENKKVSAWQAIVYLLANYCSTWNTGETWKLSIRNIYKWTGISKKKVGSIVNSMGDWMTRFGKKHISSRFKLVHHQEVEPNYLDDEVDDPLQRKFAAPQGANAPIQQMMNRRISWRACLVWMVLKLHSDFATAITFPCTIGELSTRCRLSTRYITEAIAELEKVGLLTRLSAKHEISVFQLYPRPSKVTGKPKKHSNKPNTLTSGRIGTLITVSTAAVEKMPR